MAMEKVTVSIADEYMNEFARVVRRCEQAGLQVDEELPAVGVVTGSIERGKIADLERVKGIAAVEPQRDYQLPPPESDIH